MKKNKKIGCLSLLLLSPLTMAMQPMDDQSLSFSTGQDGLNINVQLNAGAGPADANRILMRQLAVIDKDGLSYGNHTGHFLTDNITATATHYHSPDYYTKGGLVFAAVKGATSPYDIGVLFNGAATEPTLKIVMDTDAGTVATGGAFANLFVRFGNGITGLSLLPFSIYSASNSLSTVGATTTYASSSIFTTATTTKPDVKEILRVKNAMDIVFASGNTPKINIQLGATPQGKMVLFSGAVSSICGAGSGCNMVLISDGTSPTNPVGLGFDLQLTATDAVNGFSLNGFYAGIESGGFVFGNAGTTDKFDLGINNIKLGNSQNSNEFNGLTNGNIGNFGLKGVKIDNFKMQVSGL